MKIFKILITACWIIFPLGELVRISVTKDLAIHPLDILVALSVVFWFVVQVKQKKNIFREKYFLPILFFSMTGILSLILNFYWLKQNEIIVSFLYLVRWFIYTSIYFVVRSLDKDFSEKVVVKLLFFAGVLVLMLGFLQYIFFPSLMSMQIYAWDKHMYRLFSVFLDPNYAGAFLTLFFIYYLTFAKEFLKFNRRRKVIFFSLLVLILVGIFLSFSRSALLMLIAASSIYFLMTKKGKNILLLIAFLLVLIFIASFKFNIENLNLFRSASSFDRIKSAKIAMQIFEKNPIYGVGFNTYRYAQVKYNFRETNDGAISSHADAGTDNGLLFVAATTGVIGLLFYLNIWYRVIGGGIGKFNEKNRTYIACLFASIGGLVVAGQFNNAMFYGPLLLWIWTLIGVIDSKLS